MIVALAALIAAVMILASVPPVDRDALTHHLAVPKMYLRNGGIHEIPRVPFSYYPMNLDLLYMIPLYFGNDIIPKYIHFAFALLTAGLIIAFLYRRLSTLTGALLGGFLFLSLPVIVKLSISVYVDLGLIFFSTAALLQLLKWQETGLRLKHLVLAGIFAGLCLGTKPNGLLSFFFLVSAVPFLYCSAAENELSYSNEQQRAHPLMSKLMRPLGWSVGFTVMAMIVYSPWMLRNYAWTGNPIYPMAQSLFSLKASPNSTEMGGRHETQGSENGEKREKGVSGFGHFVGRKLIFGESLPEILSIPLRVFFQGQDDNPRLFDGKLNPYLFIFPILALLPMKGRRNRSARNILEIRLLGAFSLLYLLFAFFLVDMRIRYIAPIIPPLVILAVIGILDLISSIESRFSMQARWLPLGAAGVALLSLIGLNIAYLIGQCRIVDPLSYLNGNISREQYIQKYRPEYAAISFANKTLPEESRILALFNGNRIYYSERELICDNESFRKAVYASATSMDLSDRLKKDRISHLLVRLDLFNQWAENQFNSQQKAMLKSFFGETLFGLYQGHGYALFALTAG